MEDEELSRILGNRPYKEGLRMYLAGQVGSVSDIGDGLYKVKVSDADGTESIVIVGRNGRGFRFHCGCGSDHVCRHEAAAMIAVFGDVDASSVSGPEADSADNLRYIEEEIRRMGALVEECEFSGDTGERLSRAIRMAERICDDIADTVHEPVNAIRLYQMAMDLSGHDSYTDDTPRETIEARAQDFAYMLGSVPPEVLADVLESSSEDSIGYRSWVLSYLHSIPRDSTEAACDILISRGADRATYVELLFYLGRYDEYIDNARSHDAAVIRCMDALDVSGDDAGARALLPLLSGPDSIPPNVRRDAVTVLHRLGESRSAALVMRADFLDDPSEDGLKAILGESDALAENALVDDALDSVTCGRAGGYGPLAFLVEHGRGEEVCRVLEDCGYFPRRGSAIVLTTHQRGSPGSLYSSLVANGFTEEAVRLARTHIEKTLDARDSRSYDRAVSLLVMMDGTADARADGISQDGYRSILRSRYSRLHGFWSRYRDEGGTY